MNRADKVVGTLVAGSLMWLGAAGPAAADNPGGWEFSVAPFYLWAKSIGGKSRIGQAETPLDLDFQDDVLENLDGAFTVHFEARQGDLTLFAEYNYAKLDPSGEESRGPITVKADIDFEDVMYELGFMYSFYESDATRWEVLGGVRQMDQEIDVSVSSSADIGLIPDISGGDDWWHGFGGVRVSTSLTDNWRFVARADFGYNDSDNKATNASALFDYRFRDWGSFFVGYRYMDTSFDNGESGPKGYAFDADQQGPALGVVFYF